jgi:hypothetical protein
MWDFNNRPDVWPVNFKNTAAGYFKISGRLPVFAVFFDVCRKLFCFVIVDEMRFDQGRKSIEDEEEWK